MTKIKRLPSFLFIVAIVFIGVFHNCAGDNVQFGQTSTKVEVSLNTEYNGTGGTYLGKPLEGDYARMLPKYECEGLQGIQGKTFVDSSVNVQSDNCRTADFKFNFSDPFVYFNSYNRDYLGVGTAIYQYQNTAEQGLPLTEVWCSKNSGSDPLDIVIRVNNELTVSQAKIYQSRNSGARVSRYFAVARAAGMRNLSFNSDQLRLDVTLPNDSYQFGVGNFEALIDNVRYAGEMPCRIANISPITEMGTSITTSALNNFSTDLQEITCGHPGALACENLEDRTNATDMARSKFTNRGWQWEPGGYNVTNMSYDGSKALETINVANGAGSGSIGLPFANSPEIFFRYYVKWSSNFVFSPTSTGFFSTDGANGSLKLLANFDANRNLYLRSAAGDIQGNFRPETNQWYCIEGHIRSATSVAANDGIVEMWVNSSKVLTSPPSNKVDTVYIFSFYGNWYCNDANADAVCDNISDQHPLQSIYYDNILIAKQRVGCF